MRASLFALFALVIGVACVNSASAVKPPPHKQGVEGKVVALKGNFMPGPGAKRGKREPLSVPVHIFRGTVEVTDKLDSKNPALYRSIKSDEKGEYRVGLPAGEYTVVAEINGKLYLNIQEMDPKTNKAIWPHVKVEAGKWSTWNIEDTSNAAF